MKTLEVLNLSDNPGFEGLDELLVKDSVRFITGSTSTAFDDNQADSSST